MIFQAGVGGGGTFNLYSNYIHSNYENVNVSGQVLLVENTLVGGDIQFGGTVTLTGNIFIPSNRVRVDPRATLIATGNSIPFGYLRVYDRSGIVDANTVWGPTDFPHFIGSYELLVFAGATLTLQPGTVIKIGPAYGPGGLGYPSIRVQGSLLANGTPSQRIYVTSIYDDTVLGNSYYSFSHPPPAPGDFGSVIFYPGSTGAVSNMVVRYGGNILGGLGGGIYMLGGNVTLTNTRLAANLFAGLNKAGGNVTATLSSFVGNTAYGAIATSTVSALSAANNWWGSASGPFHATLNPGGAGNAVSNNVTFSPWLTSDPN